MTAGLLTAEMDIDHVAPAAISRSKGIDYFRQENVDAPNLLSMSYR